MSKSRDCQPVTVTLTLESFAALLEVDKLEYLERGNAWLAELDGPNGIEMCQMAVEEQRAFQNL